VELRRRARKLHVQPDDGLTLAERIRTKRERLLQVGGSRPSANFYTFSVSFNNIRYFNVLSENQQ
jgi:hypothetical protein